MNRIYKVIWSKVKHQYVVVSELAHSCTKSTSSRIGRSAAAVLAALVLTTGVGALSVQAADPLVEDPYAILNDKIDETNANLSDPIVTLKSTAAAMNTDAVPAAGSDAQSGSSGNTSVATPSGQHTIYNEEGFYAHNGQGTYNSLTKDGLFVGGTDNGEGLYVDNDGNIYTDGNAEIEGSFSAADGNATIAADGTTVIRAGGSQLVVNDGAAGITHGNAIMAVSSNKAEMQGGGSSVIADLNGVTLTERTGNTTVTVDQNGMTVDGDFTVTGDTNLKNTGIDGDLGVSGDTILNQDLTVGGTSNLRDTSVDGALGVSGNATFNSDVTVTGDTNLKSASVDGALGVSGNATFNSDVTVTGNTNLKTASVDGTLGVSGNATFNSDVTVTGDTNLKNASVDGILGVSGNATFNSDVTVTGNTNLKNASVDGTLNVSDNASFEKNISAVGEIKGGTFANTTNTFSVNDDGDVTAVDITANGALTGATIANANGSFNVDASGNVSANDVTAVGDVTGATFANTTDTFTVNADGDITSGDVSATGNVTATGNVQGATFSNTGNTFSVNADGDVTAADVTASGALTGATIANANGSFSVDASGNVSGNDVTAIGDVTGATFANTTDTFTVNADGDITSGDVSATGNVTATGNVQGVTFSNTGNTFSVNADGDVTAADVTASGALTGATIANANNSFKVDTSGNVSANNVTALGGVSGMTFANTLNTFAVDVDGNITGESIIVDGKTYISNTGINANSQKITNVADGDITSADSKDAVNGGQLYTVSQSIKTYQEGDGINIANGDTQTPTISVDAGNGLTTASGSLEIQLADNSNLVANGDGLSLSTTLTGLTSIETGTLTATGAVTATSFGVGSNTYISNTGINANSQKITNVADGDITSADSKDAVNGGQLYTVSQSIKTYQEGDGINIANGDTQTPTISVDAGNGLTTESGSLDIQLADNSNLVVNGDGLSLSSTLTGLTSIGTGTLTATGAVTAASFGVGSNTYISNTGINANSQKITNVADGDITSADSKDAVNGGQLYTVSQSIKTYQEGDGINIANGDTQTPTISVDAGNGLTTASGSLEIQLADNSNLVANGNGLSLSTALTGLTSIGTETLTASGAVTAGSVVVGGTTYISNSGLNAGGNVISNVGRATLEDQAVNLGQLNDLLDGVEGTTYTAGDGIDITKGTSDSNPTISVDTGNGLEIATDGSVAVKVNGSNLVANGDGLSLSTTLTGLTSIETGTLTATGAVTGGSFAVGNNTYISSTGINANSQKITNVANGDSTYDAVNYGQLQGVVNTVKTYQEGDGINIANGDTQTPTISVDAGNGLTTANGSLEIQLADNSNLVANGDGLSLSTTLTGLTSIGTGTLTATGAITAGSFSTTGSATIGNITINANNGGKITGLIAGDVSENSTEAVNGSQLYKVQQISDLAVTYRDASKQEVELAANNGTGTKLTNVANGTLSSTSKEAVNGSQLYATNQIVGDGEYNSHNYITRNQIDMDLTDAVSALDAAIGNNRYTSGNILDANTDGQTYTSITAAVDTLNRSIGSLTFNTPQSYFSVGTHFNDVTTALNELSGAIGPMQFDTTNNFIDNDSNLSSAIDKLDENIGSALKNVGFRTDASGKVTTDIDWTGSSYENNGGTTIISAVKDLDGRVTNLEAAGQTLSAFSRSNISALSTLSNMDVSAVNALSSLSADDLSKLSEISVASDVSGAAETSGTNPTNNSGRPDRGPGSGADDSISHDGDTVTVDNNVKVTGNTDLQGNLNVGGDTTLGGKLEVGGDATFNGNVDMNGTLNMNGNKITGVADGEISADSTDAVNGSQLHDAWQQINSNTENIGILGSAVNKLGDRIERVGAGAAALAALHPLDFDPDNKLDFAAGFGNYRGASAVAVGAFYRPSENVMFSVGGAFGGGEDMVNAGVSFKVGAGSGSVTTSRTAMAKSLKSMQEVVATQDAQLAQQREQIEKLTAMVELLMEQSGQTQPKDDGADTAQPQQ